MRFEKKTLRTCAVIALSLAVFVGLMGCGSGDGSAQLEREAGQEAAQRAEVVAERRQARLAHRAEAREAREAARRRARRVAARELARREAEAREEAEAQEAAEAEASECDPSYSGACLDPYASDYDCEGGSGDGPEYTGPVTVVGDDHYGLDSDNDGYGCEY
jgi:hypothetical protein